MLGIDYRSARGVWTAAVVVLGLWLLYQLRSALFLFVVAMMFAYLLAPLVNLIDRLLPGRRTRTLALALAYVLVVGAAVVAGIQIGTHVVEQATQLAHQLPKALNRWQFSFENQLPESIRAPINARFNELLAALPSYGLKFLGLMGNLIYVVVVPVLAFLCLKDGALAKQHIVGLLEAGPQRKLLDDVLADMDLVLAHYMRALVLLSLSTFTFYSIFLSVVGVPYGILLGALSALLEFIPMIGPLAGELTVLAIGALSGGNVIAILIFLVAFRMFQDYVLSPHVMGHGVELHPLLVLFGVFAGWELAGIAGTFLSVPVLALVRVLYLRIYQARQQAQSARLVA